MAAAGRQVDVTPAEIESSVSDGKPGVADALRAKPEDMREQYERQPRGLQETYGEAMLEIRDRGKLSFLLGRDES